ncbi:MAG TPA: DUF3152 domain-containing protein [Kribbella sp.]|nr:DUF3152 domain-containing protein [Kribbella sp.]
MRKVRIIALMVVATVAVGVLHQLPASPFNEREYPDRSAGVPTVEPSAPPAVRPAERTVTYPIRGTGAFAVLPGHPGTIGPAGRLMRYRLAVEGGIQGIDRPELARFVRQTYAAPQGWTAGGLWRFRQVGPGDTADFTLMLVTPATRDQLCGGGYDRSTSCRIGSRVVLNVARWVHGVPDYGASLATYRQYMINHETGHRLGEAHELCPAPGALAPVMQQQTLGMHGCTANAWPYRGGRRYEGRLGRYNDPIPRS